MFLNKWEELAKVLGKFFKHSIRFPTDYYVFLSKLIIVIHDWRERLISSLQMNLQLRKMSCPRMTRPD